MTIPPSLTIAPVSRRTLLRGALLLGTASLAGCISTDFGGTPAPSAGPAPPRAEIGSGPVTVALLAPLSAGGGGGAAGVAIRNACELAMAEVGGGAFQLLVKDDLGTPDGAKAAAEAALAEGARLMLGPVFGPSVRAAGAVARSGGVPMIAFSSDASVAAPGVYLLSFMPQSDVARIIPYAASIGKGSIAALIPQTAYGTVVQGELQQVAGRLGLRLAAIETYPVDRLGMQAPITRIAAVLKSGQADALFAPEGGDALPLIAQSLTASSVDPQSLQLLGTGVWDDPRIFADPLLQGGLYAAPDGSGFRAFAGRYRARYGQDPVRIASLGYDAVSLAAGLTKAYGAAAFTDQTLTSPTGFIGIDGAFRFRSDGTSERSLAVLRVTPAGGEVVSPAPQSFTA